MVRSRPVGLFILSLCLVACVCAHAAVSRNEAAKIVNEVQKSTEKALRDIKLEVVDAIRLRNDANAYKQNVEKAAKEAEKAAQGNTEAEAIVEEAKNASAEVIKLYPNAFELANKYAESMKKLRKRAQKLDNRARRELFVSEWQEGDYTKMKKEADAIKAEAAAFDNEVQEAMKPYTAMVDAQNEMPKFVSAAQRAKYHVDVIVAVAKIDTLLNSADTDIGLTEQKIAEINATVQEMKNLADSSPEDLIIYLSRLHSMVEDHLTSASHEVKKAKEVKTRMLAIKAQADETLGKVKSETDVEKAESEADAAHWAVKNAEKEVEEIKKALKSVTKSATDALHWKTSALNAIKQNKKKTDAAHDSGKTNSPDSANTHQPVQGTTKIPVESGAEQITITATEKSTDKESVIKTTEKSAESKTKQETKPIPVKPVSVKPKEDSKENDTGIKDKKPIITTQDQPVGEQPADETTESPEGTETKQDKIPIPVKPVSVKPKEDSKENDTGIKDKKPIITTQDQPVGEQPADETTESPEGTETKQDKIPIPVKPVSVKPKEDSKENDAGIKDKKLIITTQDQPKSEQPVDETTESPEGNETEKPTMTNSEQPVSGGTDPIKPFSSDSAMTVSVPLLLAMVACAALH